MMIFSRILVLLIVSFWLTACGQENNDPTQLGKKSVMSALKDPGSADFRNLHYYVKTQNKDGTTVGFVCGEVNAKNSFGAYTGFKKFMVPAGVGVKKAVASDAIIESDNGFVLTLIENSCS
ncbi:hypothetical protein [Martelella alba]|uniref:Lipoprotein n=1 Tax=Martelella alba TaxID=2590451 RepID=A0ABY2SDQ9_9HYPH|nr:hypothetical protein [Martelella alba]TKI02661.1 hypothetical protein FCN80_24185 [Martelella alba]